MARARDVFGAIVLKAIILAAASTNAATLSIGDKAPDWSGVVGTNDEKHGLSDYKNAKLIALVFTCNHCPVAKAYEDRLVAIQRDYKNKGVQVIAVNVNNLPEDKLDKMKERAKDKRFNFPYLYDPTQKMGRDHGAKVTPHVFLLDQTRKLAYRGAIDDNMNLARRKVDYLRDALDALLAGKTPPKTETKEVGCSVKYEKDNKD